MNDNYLLLETHIVSRLQGIDGLTVATTTDVSETMLKAIAKPTAVVVFGGDERGDSNPYAVQLKQSWSVYLLCRGAGKARQQTDGQLLLAIVKALHGWTPDEALFAPFTYSGTQPDFEDNAREYWATFETTATLAL